jgi:hypothetical protein
VKVTDKTLSRENLGKVCCARRMPSEERGEGRRREVGGGMGGVLGVLDYWNDGWPAGG